MRSFGHLSIRRMLTAIITVTSCLVLLLAGAIAAINEARSLRQRLVENLTTLAEVVGRNCAPALTSSDEQAVTRTLAAVGADPHVTAAHVFTAEGRLFARYRRRPHAAPAAAQPAPDSRDEAVHRWGADHVDLWRSITLEGERIGTLHVQKDRVELDRLLRRYLTGGALVLMFSTVVACGLSLWLRRPVSEPVVELARLVKTFLAGGDDDSAPDSPRRDRGDELGILFERFNRWVREEETRGEEIEGHRHQVEALGEPRTVELSRADRELTRAVAAVPGQKEAAEPGSRSESQRQAEPSHRLGTATKGAVGKTEWLTDTKREERQRYCRETGHDGTEGLLAVMNGFLDLSRIDAGELELETIDGDPYRAAAETTALLPENIEPQGTRATMDIRVPIDSSEFDRTRALQREGEPDFQERLIQTYFGLAPELLRQLDDAVAAGDAPSVERVAHTLKTSSAALGANGMAELCQRMETGGRARSLEEAPALLAQIRSDYERSRAGLAFQLGVLRDREREPTLEMEPAR